MAAPNGNSQSPDPAPGFASTYVAHMISGASAGVAENVIMYPVDLVKTRAQAATSADHVHYRGLSHAIREILKHEGVRGLFKGVGALGLGAAPSHALYFATYEACRKAFGAEHGYHSVSTGAAAVIGTLVEDFVMCPWDVIKQRIQLHRQGERTMRECARQIYREEGLRAFWLSYPTTLAMKIPFTAIHFPAYEAMRLMLHKEAHLHGTALDMTSGAVAGALAAGLTNPLDVVKTRLQTQSGYSQDKVYSGFTMAVGRIWAEEGPRAFWRGVRERMIFQAPSGAICWATYEFANRVLGFPRPEE
mmetsp:Transcript_38562/g.64045  ORF Transcript_38562/g.64045 Transcript_38562/m.64045 type:complete len:304 (+) Transcript_38562:11-922(+)